MRARVALVVLLLCVTAVTVAAPANAAVRATIVNAGAAGEPVLRLDDTGAALDAHDGELIRFGDRYFLYGTSYGCGFRWRENARFCGFRAYSSPDLEHWTDEGLVVGPRACSGCFRPHVLYNLRTHRFVLWYNDSAAPAGARVAVARRPDGPFVPAPDPVLAVPCGWDLSLYAEPDGTGYVTHTEDCRGGGVVVERLTPDYLSTTGESGSLRVHDVEAPALFRRGGTYYVTVSDPVCPYCAGTGTGYLTSRHPLGPWHGRYTPVPWQVRGGELRVYGGDTSGSATGADWRDYTLALDATPRGTARYRGQEYALAGWTARTDGAGNGYAFLLTNLDAGQRPGRGALVFARLYRGNPVSAEAAALPFPVRAGRAYHAETVVSGDRFVVSIDGVPAGTFTDDRYATGRVGFHESSANDESADFDNVRVTAPDGRVLLADDFSGDLSAWRPPAPMNRSTIVSADSCGGQPAHVTALPTRTGTAYLYQSDRWQAGAANQSLAGQFWAPLRFTADGGIAPMPCPATVSLDLTAGHPGRASPPGTDAHATGTAFGTACDVAGSVRRRQEFTAGRSGRLRRVAVTAYRQGVPDASLQVRVTAGGRVLAARSIPAQAVSLSPTPVTVDPGIPVTRGRRYAVELVSAADTGCYGVAVSSGDRYAGGAAAVDRGDGYVDAPGDLAFRTVVAGRR